MEQHMDVQQLVDYEASFQFALGDVLRDLAILMRYSEQGQPCDDATYTRALQHLKTFHERLSALEQDLQTEHEQQNEKIDRTA
jgi:hypothetical protein